MLDGWEVCLYLEIPYFLENLSRLLPPSIPPLAHPLQLAHNILWKMPQGLLTPAEWVIIGTCPTIGC
jgi:hypothetical protein